MGRVIFVEGMRDYREKKISWLWFGLWLLVGALFLMFVIHPDWFVLPSFVHSIHVTLGN